MSLITALTLAGFINTSHAGSPLVNPVSLTDFEEWHLSEKIGSVESVTLEGTVEVPLYKDSKGRPTLKTFVTTPATEEGDRGDLVHLIPELPHIFITEDFAKRNELDIKVTNKRLIPVPTDYKVGGEIKYAVIPTLNVGGMVLSNVTGFVIGAEEELFDDKFTEMVIGLAALPTSYAVLHSQGIVKFSDDGAGLMKELGVEGVPYKSAVDMVGTIGKKTLSGKNKHIILGEKLIVDAQFGDSDTVVQTSLKFRNSASILDKYSDATSDINTYRADVRTDWMTSTVGDLELVPTYVRRYVLKDLIDGLVADSAQIGYDVLIEYDVVVDKTSETIGLSKHDGFQFQTFFDIELEIALDNLEAKPDDDSEEDTAEQTDGEQSEKLNVSGLYEVISVLESGGSLEKAIEKYDLLLEDEEEKTDCNLWLDYGSVQYRLGNLDVARQAFLKSSRLYHSWWDIDLGRRMDINNAQSDMSEEEVEAAKARSKEADINSVEDGWYISQPESCYRVDSYVAAVDLVNGDHKAVETSYRNNLDLDAQLAQVFASSAMVQGKTELAHEAIRQSIKLEDGRSERALNRFTLALIYADQGKWEQADALFQEAVTLNDDPFHTMIWMDNAIAQTDETTAVEMMRDWSKRHPKHAGSRLAELRFWTQKVADLTAESSPIETDGEDDIQEAATGSEETPENANPSVNEELSKATASLQEAQQALLEWIPKTDSWNRNTFTTRKAVQLLGYSYAGDLEQAKEVLESVEGLIDINSQLSFAAANYYALNGNAEAAANALQRTASLHPADPSRALLLTSK